MLHFTFTSGKCTRKFFMSTIDKLIKSPKTNGRYLLLLVQFNTKENDIINITDEIIVDRLNPYSIKICKFYFNLKYNEYFVENTLEITSMNVLFDDVSKDIYSNFIKEFYREP